MKIDVEMYVSKIERINDSGQISHWATVTVATKSQDIALCSKEFQFADWYDFNIIKEEAIKNMAEFYYLEVEGD